MRFDRVGSQHGGSQEHTAQDLQVSPHDSPQWTPLIPSPNSFLLIPSPNPLPHKEVHSGMMAGYTKETL